MNCLRVFDLVFCDDSFSCVYVQREHSILGSVISALNRSVSANANRSNSLTVPTTVKHPRLSPTTSLRYPSSSSSRRSPPAKDPLLGPLELSTRNDPHLYPFVRIEYCPSPTDTTTTPQNSSQRISSLSSNDEATLRKSERSNGHLTLSSFILIAPFIGF